MDTAAPDELHDLTTGKAGPERRSRVAIHRILELLNISNCPGGSDRAGPDERAATSCGPRRAPASDNRLGTRTH